MSEVEKSTPEPAGPTAVENPEKTAARNGADGSAEAEESSAAGESPELEQVKAERDQAAGERDELLDRCRRMQAEFENTRKRLSREKEEVVQYAAADTIESLLPIMDDFERAIETEGLDPEIRKGLELIRKRLLDALARAGLREIEQHERFDPHLHYALDRAPAEEDQEDQTILEVYQKGYRFKDRLLRASMVKVAVKE